jgi:hypothetical protein
VVGGVVAIVMCILLFATNPSAKQKQDAPCANLTVSGWKKDVLLNPYSPPLRDERYFPMSSERSFPINVPTQPSGVDANYRQVGILTPSHGSVANHILPLMGRPLFSSRQKWQYYTISNQHNNVKLPVRVKGKSGTSDYGVDEVFSGDFVFVEGDKAKYTATLYDNETMRYLPF